MSLSKMRLERCWQTHLEIIARQDRSGTEPSPDESEVQLRIGFNVHKHKTEMKFRVPMEIDLNWDEKTGHQLKRISIGLIGIFAFPKDAEEVVIRRYVPMLCLTNLYGIARGFLAQATGSFQGGSYYLPLVDMLQVVREARNEDEQMLLESEN